MANVFIKRISEVADYQVDWAELIGSDTISGSTWAVDTGITKDSDSHDASTTTIWVSGGSVNTNYKLTNTIVTAGARTFVKDIFIFVEPLTLASPRTLYSLVSALAIRLNDPAGVIYESAKLKDYINAAVSYWDSNGGYIVAIDQSMVTVDNQHTYNLPSAITSPRQVLRVLRRRSVPADLAVADLSTGYNHATGQVIVEPWQDMTAFKMTVNGTTVKMLLATPLASTDVIGVVYKTSHAIMVNDTDTTDVSPEFIYAYARYLAHNEMASRAGQEDRKYHVEERDAALRDTLKILDVAMRNQTLDPILQKAFPLVADW